MSKKTKPFLNYNNQDDILYMGVADNSNSYGAETTDTLNVFRDVETDEITGFVIFGFNKKYISHRLPQISEPM